MNQPKRQVKFECSEQFYNRLMDEKLQRNLTLQQLAIRALERYLAMSESAHRELDEVTREYGYDIQQALKEILAAVRRASAISVRARLPPDPQELERRGLGRSYWCSARAFSAGEAAADQGCAHDGCQTLRARHARAPLEAPSGEGEQKGILMGRKRTRKRANGEGSLYPRSDGRWAGEITLRFDEEGGRLDVLFMAALKRKQGPSWTT